MNFIVKLGSRNIIFDDPLKALLDPANLVKITGETDWRNRLDTSVANYVNTSNRRAESDRLVIENTGLSSVFSTNATLSTNTVYGLIRLIKSVYSHFKEKDRNVQDAERLIHFCDTLQADIRHS